MHRWVWLGIVCALTLAAPHALAQTSSSAVLADGQEFDDCGGAPWCPRMVVVPAGDFRMGSPDHETGRARDEGPQHRVWITEFAVGKFEVTFEQWDACVAGGGCATRADDAAWGRSDRPVINVSWEDANAYVRWLSAQTGQDYRLLSEAEWEYAARAGRTTPFGTGHTIRPSQANFGGVTGQTRPVGAYPANAFGLHDMHGNVWELVSDCFANRYPLSVQAAAYDREGCFYRVARGGAWSAHAAAARSANRLMIAAQARGPAVGFRVARTLDARSASSLPAD